MERYSPRKLQRMIRGYKKVREFIPLGETEIRDRVKKGTFPRPIQLGPRAVAWTEDQLIDEQERLRKEQAEG